MHLIPRPQPILEAEQYGLVSGGVRKQLNGSVRRERHVAQPEELIRNIRVDNLPAGRCRRDDTCGQEATQHEKQGQQKSCDTHGLPPETKKLCAIVLD
ncbi:MAG: hypothetical protein WC497_06275 [Patescibacteria group bacterium]